MLSNDAEGLTVNEAREKSRCAEVPVRQNHCPGSDTLQDLPQERSLLGIGVLTRNRIHHQIDGRIVQHQRLAGQRSRSCSPQFFQPMLRPRQMISIQDEHSISRQHAFRGLVQVLNHRSQLARRVSHEFRGNMRFDAAKLLIYRVADDIERVPEVLVPSVDRTRRPRHDVGHDGGDLRKRQIHRELLNRRILKQLIQCGAAERPFHDRIDQHRDWRFLNEPTQDFPEDHPGTLRDSFPREHSEPVV